MQRKQIVSTALVLLVLGCATLVYGATREDVVKRGYLQCGVSTGIPGFSVSDAQGNWTGLDVDLCRAVAAATLGDGEKVKYTPLSAKERFIALQSGVVDILAGSTWTLTRDSALGVHFAGISYYDGQGFLVAKRLGGQNIDALEEPVVCLQVATTAELNMADYFTMREKKFTPILFDTLDQAIKGLEDGRCNVVSGNQSQLYGLHLKLAEPDEFVVLPQVISNEPQGPVVRQGDDAWFNIVQWSLFAMINGEELGVTSANIVSLKKSDDPALKRFLGMEGIKGEGLGLPDDWAARIIEQVGNYGEVFERNLGQNSPLKIARARNGLWADGGLHYAPPFR